MPILLLGIAILIIGWLAARSLAIVIQQALGWSRLSALAARILNWEDPESFQDRAGRIIYYSLMMLTTALALAVVFGLEPAHLVVVGIAGRLLGYQFIPLATPLPREHLVLVLSLVAGLQLILLINRFYLRLYQKLDDWGRTHLRVVKIQDLEVFTPNRLTDLLLRLTKFMRVGFTLLVISISLTLIFSFYPETRGWMQPVWNGIAAYFSSLGRTFLRFFPNLLTLALILLTTHYSLKVLRFFANGFSQGKIKHSRIHPELARPTFQIVRVLIIGLAIVAAFPYIPGSDSPVFRGISIFVGFLLSLGSTSLVTNVVSGIVLTYTRGMAVGDRVQIGDAIGDVVERSLLVTRIRTIKNVDITIPNGMVLSNHIVNYSSAAVETGLILNTRVTIGYDAPWRTVHQLLIGAALNTEHILEFPEPFVLQTSLDDFYVTYELNVYTMKPNRMASIYSELHQNIQDIFNEAEVEILSPNYAAVRDGQLPGIPVDYLPKNFTPTVFRAYPHGNGPNHG